MIPGNDNNGGQERRTLWIVLLLNAAIAAGFFVSGFFADSSALIANGVDNLSDTAVYALSLVALTRGQTWKTRAAVASGVMLLIFAGGILIDVGRRYVQGSEPIGPTMMVMSAIAGVVNYLCLRLLQRLKDPDVNLRAATTFSFNDFISNGGILIAGVLVLWLGTNWPDLLVGFATAIIAIKGGVEILRDARRNQEKRKEVVMNDKLELDIPVLLPDLPDAADACLDRLVSTLSKREGVERAHVICLDGNTPAALCIHFDAAKLPLPRLREMVRAAGAEITERYGHAIWQVTGINHERRARTVSDALCALPGVVQASASTSGSVRVEYDRRETTEEEVRAALRKLKVRVGKRVAADEHAGHDHGPGGHGAGEEKHGPGDGHDHSHAEFLGPNTELIFALACGALLGIGYAIERLVAGAPEWLPTACYIAAYFFGGFFTLREAIDNLRMKKFEIDTLMLVAAAGAAALGAWAEGALLLFLFSLGHALEHYAMGRAKKAIEALAKLAPETATVRRGGQTSEIPVEQMVVGDIAIVRPNERLPADGFVIKGTSAINQAPVTGESIPVDKVPVADAAAARAKPDAVDAESRVFAGTINGGGAIEIEVTRRSNESALAKVVKMVSEAETQKSPTQRFTDRFERIFVPAVLVLSVLLLFAWVVVDEPFRDSFYRAMAVLVAASPCALAIATPSAVLSGVARAARGGVLVKGGAPLENLGSLKAIAFDKTGTLTEGRPRITDVVPVDGADEGELLALAVAVEALSDHPWPKRSSRTAANV
jgi:Cd2+/Zn2+-exporting ATPase